MIEFIVAATLIVVFTLLSLLRPWHRFRVDTAVSIREINAGIYLDQLAELDCDRAAGALAEADCAQSRAELRRRLLDDARTDESGARVAPATRTTSMLIALVVPLLAGSLYAWLGQPAALDERARRGTSQAEADDPAGWVVLARSYRAMGRVRDAQTAFERIGPELDRDPMLLAEYAEVLASAANGHFEGKPLAMAERALSLAPDLPLALALAATAAFNRGDLSQAASHWERILKQLPPESDDAKWVVDQLARTHGAAHAAGGAARTTRR
jgi:cytochrome c-type biogenesis protein CcmH